MKKFLFLTAVVISSTIVSSCEPARPGGYDAPANGNETGTIEQTETGQVDSSIEKQLHKTATDSVTPK